MPKDPEQRPQILPADPAAAASLAELARRAIAGDRTAFDAIHARLAPAVRRMLLQRAAGREDLADDLAQRTWLAVWKAFEEHKYDPAKSAVSTFLYAVGFKVWLQHLRQSGRRAEAALNADALDAFGATLDDATPPRVAAHELLDSLRAALRGEGDGALTEEERQIVVASASGVPDRQLAARLGVAPSTLNVRKQAALAKLRRYLATRGFRDSTEHDAPAGG